MYNVSVIALQSPISAASRSRTDAEFRHHLLVQLQDVGTASRRDDRPITGRRVQVMVEGGQQVDRLETRSKISTTNSSQARQ